VSLLIARGTSKGFSRIGRGEIAEFLAGELSPNRRLVVHAGGERYEVEVSERGTVLCIAQTADGYVYGDKCLEKLTSLGEEALAEIVELPKGAVEELDLLLNPAAKASKSYEEVIGMVKSRAEEKAREEPVKPVTEEPQPPQTEAPPKEEPPPPPQPQVKQTPEMPAEMPEGREEVKAVEEPQPTVPSIPQEPLEVHEYAGREAAAIDERLRGRGILVGRVFNLLSATALLTAGHEARVEPEGRSCIDILDDMASLMADKKAILVYCEANGARAYLYLKGKRLLPYYEEDGGAYMGEKALEAISERFDPGRATVQVKVYYM